MRIKLVNIDQRLSRDVSGFLRRKVIRAKCPSCPDVISVVQRPGGVTVFRVSLRNCVLNAVQLNVEADENLAYARLPQLNVQPLGSEGRMKQISIAGNTVVPGLLALESLGFRISVERTGDREHFRAKRGEESYLADDPIAVLGLVKLIEVRGWGWQAADADLDRVLRQYELG